MHNFHANLTSTTTIQRPISLFIKLTLLCLICLIQVTYAPLLCSLSQEYSPYWCNGTWEYCCSTGCCLVLPSDDFRLYNFWYFWVGLGAAFVLLIISTVVCALKCCRTPNTSLVWARDNDGSDLYRTVQDARGLIRPFLVSKQPSSSSGISGGGCAGAGGIMTHPYGVPGNGDSGLAPLQPPYPPLRPPYENDLATRRNSDHIASIILPPGFVPHESHSSRS